MSDLRIENSVLREALRLTAKALNDYHERPHFEIEDDHDGTPMMEVIIPASLREKAADALARANAALKYEERGAGR